MKFSIGYSICFRFFIWRCWIKFSMTVCEEIRNLMWLVMLNQVQDRFQHVVKTSTVMLENFVLKIYSASSWTEFRFRHLTKRCWIKAQHTIKAPLFPAWRLGLKYVILTKCKEMLNLFQHRLRHLFPFFHLKMLNQVQHDGLRGNT